MLPMHFLIAVAQAQWGKWNLLAKEQWWNPLRMLLLLWESTKFLKLSQQIAVPTSFYVWNDKWHAKKNKNLKKYIWIKTVNNKKLELLLKKIVVKPNFWSNKLLETFVLQIRILQGITAGAKTNCTNNYSIFFSNPISIQMKTINLDKFLKIFWWFMLSFLPPKIQKCMTMFNAIFLACLDIHIIIQG